MNQHDIRWVQRFNKYSKALELLTKFIEKGDLNEQLFFFLQKNRSGFTAMPL